MHNFQIYCISNGVEKVGIWVLLSKRPTLWLTLMHTAGDKVIHLRYNSLVCYWFWIGFLDQAKLCKMTQEKPPNISWLRHQMGTVSALLVLCAGNSPVTGEFRSQRPVTRRFDVSFDLRQNKQISKQSRRSLVIRDAIALIVASLECSQSMREWIYIPPEP